MLSVARPPLSSHLFHRTCLTCFGRLSTFAHLPRSNTLAARSHNISRPNGRPITSMAHTSSPSLQRASSSPFTQFVVQTMRELFPEDLADKSFDNTGLLLEAPSRPDRKAQKNSVLLTVDLTRAVVDEAIEKQVSVIVAYHPIIFRPLKAITLADPQQESLLRLVQEGISVYSPHTAVDASPDGLGTFLAKVLTQADEDNESAFSEFWHQKSLPHTRHVIRPAGEDASVPGSGIGRIVRFGDPQHLPILMRRVTRRLGLFRHVPLAIPQGRDLDGIYISSVAVCAGSGGSLLRGLDVDMLLTGELSHHETLAAVERNQVVLAPFHSNTERAYLQAILQPMLFGRLSLDLGSPDPRYRNVTVDVSSIDRDPFQIVEC